MIVKINIMDMDTGDEGILQWDNESKGPVMWGLLDGSVELRTKLAKYFNTKQEYMMPVDEETDQLELVEEKPLNGVMYFELSLSELFSQINIRLGKVTK